MNIQLLLTGNELMTGDTVDSNSAEIAQQLNPHGAQIQRKLTVGDDFELLVASLQQITASADVLIVNGGLGPTDDDLTALALAQLTGQPLLQHPQALSHLETWCQRRGNAINETNLKQTLLPAGAAIIPNPRGSAVGIHLTHNGCEIFATPGVPSELKAMLENSIVAAITANLPADVQLLRQRYQVFGLGESALQQWVKDELPDWPEEVELGFRSGAPTLEVKVQTLAGNRQLHEHWKQQLEQLLGSYIVCKDGDSLAQELVRLLQSKALKITTAESCTGGLIASMLTRIAGASAVFEAGFVTYANRIKASLLDVNETDLQQQGAVSETVVRQMALGALKKSHADYAIAVSGIAGPDGGSPEKPVGTVWMAWGTETQMHSQCLYFPYHRQLFQIMVAGTGLDLIRREILGIKEAARYLQDRKPPAP